MDEVRMVRALPRPGLRSLITSYTGYLVRSAAGVHRGLPSRSLTFIVTIDGTVDVTLGDEGRKSLACLASGLHSSPALIDHPGYQYGIQADLTPLGARALLGAPAGVLASTVVDLSALVGPAAAELIERMRGAGSWTDRFATLDNWVARTAMPARVRAELGWVWQRLTDTSGRADVAGLAAEVGWSRQYLGVQFRREFGLSPKVAGRVMRFEAAGQLLRAAPRLGLADIAARCGYADQAHLTRDWHTLAGVTPTVWLADELPNLQDAAPVAG
jgi:AraC-like DNA-binding protein